MIYIEGKSHLRLVLKAMDYHSWEGKNAHWIPYLNKTMNCLSPHVVQGILHNIIERTHVVNEFANPNQSEFRCKKHFENLIYWSPLSGNISVHTFRTFFFFRKQNVLTCVWIMGYQSASFCDCFWPLIILQIDNDIFLYPYQQRGKALL